MIYPSILTDERAIAQRHLDDFSTLKPKPEVIHFDIIDGLFADEITLEPIVLRDLNRYDFLFDVHLMTVEPADQLEEMVGSPSIRSVIAQVERMPDQHEFLQLVIQQGWRAGLSLDLYTPTEAIDTSSWRLLSYVQVMGGMAGVQGQFFHPSTLSTIKELYKLRQQEKLQFRIMVDIGMNAETLSLATKAGADDFVVGSYLNTDFQLHWKNLQRNEK